MQKGKAKAQKGKTETEDVGGMPLKKLEEIKGLTPEKVVEMLKEKGIVIADFTYRSWRDNRVNFHRKELLALAEVFGVSVDYLLGRVDLSWQENEYLSFPWRRLRKVPLGEEQELVKAFEAAIQGKAPRQNTNMLQLERIIDDGLIEVDINFNDNDSKQWDDDFQEKLKMKFGLHEVFIPARPLPKDLSLIIIGEIAAKFFAEKIQNGRISLSGGSTLARMVMSLRKYRLGGLELFPLEILPVPGQVAISSNTLCGMFELFHPRQHVRSHGYQHFISPVSPGEDAVQIYRGEIRHLLSDASGLDNAAVVGIGALDSFFSSTTLNVVLHALNMNAQELIERHLAVGDILFHAIDINGNEVSHPINRLILSVGLDRLRIMAQLSKRPVVAVAAGIRKAKATYGVLKGKYVNTIILDRELAEKVIERAEIEEYKQSLSENVKEVIKQKAIDRIVSEMRNNKENYWIKNIIELAMELGENERKAINQIQREQSLEEVKKGIESLDVFKRMKWEIEDWLIAELWKDKIKPSNEKEIRRLLDAKKTELLRHPLIPSELVDIGS